MLGSKKFDVKIMFADLIEGIDFHGEAIHTRYCAYGLQLRDV